MSDPKQRDLDSVGRAASWLRERSKDPDPIPLGRARDGQDGQDWPAQGKPDETVAHLRPVEPRDWHVHRQSDVFAAAVARAMQEQGEPDLVHEVRREPTHQRGVGVDECSPGSAPGLVWDRRCDQTVEQRRDIGLSR